jgi:trk system potassium uptake protein TrkA
MFIIIIGCGRFGSNLAKGLSDDGYDVSIIDNNVERLNALGSGFNGRRIKGVEYDNDNLIEAGIEEADALIAVTANDNINITVSLIADKIYKVSQIIARVNEPDKNSFYQTLGINTINPIQYEVEIIKSKLPIKSLDVISTLDNDCEIIEFFVSKEKSVNVEEVESKFHCNISAIIKDKEVKIVKKNDEISMGDKVICTVYKKDKGKLINYFCKEMFL